MLFLFPDMRLCLVLAVTLMSVLMAVVHGADKKKLQIGIKKRVDNCPIKSRKGDVLNMHYTVSVQIIIQIIINVKISICLVINCVLICRGNWKMGQNLTVASQGISPSPSHLALGRLSKAGIRVYWGEQVLYY